MKPVVGMQTSVEDVRANSNSNMGGEGEEERKPTVMTRRQIAKLKEESMAAAEASSPTMNQLEAKVFTPAPNPPIAGMYHQIPAHVREQIEQKKSMDGEARAPLDATQVAVETASTSTLLPYKPAGWTLPMAQLSEYELVLQKGAAGLCMNVSLEDDKAVITGFRRPPSGEVGPAESSGLIQPGDSILALDDNLILTKEDFLSFIPLLKSPHPVKIKFKRPSPGIVKTVVTHTAAASEMSLAQDSSPKSYPPGTAHRGVRYVAPNQWVAEVAVPSGGVIRLGFFPSEQHAAQAHNAYVYSQYGPSGIQLMHPAAMPSTLPSPRASVAQGTAPVQHPRVKANFIPIQKEQLRAQIMAFKYIVGYATIPPDIYYQAVMPGQVAPNKFKSRVADALRVNRLKTGGNNRPSRSTKRKKKKVESEEEEEEDNEEETESSEDDEDDYEGSYKRKKKAAIADSQPQRRSGRAKAVKRYNLSDSEKERDDEEEEEEKPVEEEKGPTIDKFLGVRFIASSEDDDPSMEFYIKWKGQSYLHLSWLSVEELENMGPFVVRRIKTYLQKFPDEVEDARSHVLIGDAKPVHNPVYFSPSYTEVDRILASKEVEEEEEEEEEESIENGQKVLKKGTKLLVKWRDLSYKESTWEWKDAIDDNRKIAEFHRFNHPPMLDGAHPAMTKDIRPPATEWAKYEASPQFTNQNSLRSYQLEGLNWMIFCWYNRRNCILADEMGLGKTIQAISVLDHLRQREHIRGPFLIVAPLATLGNWKREIESWTNMNCVVYHDSEGGAETRKLIRDHEFYFENESFKRKGIYKFNILLTSYNIIIQDAEVLSSIQWRYVVVDEAHRLKNRDAKLMQSMATYKWNSSLIMTGTPLQNGVDELWCLLNFIEPNKFDDQATFYEKFGELSTAAQVAALHDELRPFMLRRVKEDVEKTIPPKEETVIDVELTTLQKKYYRAIFEKNRDFLNMGSKIPVSNLMNVEMELRKCCNHPFLLRGVEEKECAHMTEEERFSTLLQASGKAVLLDKMLSKFHAEGKKVLIFSQFKMMLDVIEDLLCHRAYRYERMDGSVTGNVRQAAIDRFNDLKSNTFVFLLSTKAGGVGINLIAASVVVLFDSDWNPQNDLQAVARCHRIGQKNAVLIYRLVTKKTYEAQMFGIASRKLGMHQAVFESGGVRKGFDGEEEEEGGGSNGMMSLLSLDKDKIESLMKYGAYAIMDHDEEDPENKKMNEADIDTILSASRTIRYEDGKVAEGQDSALSFSKATFTSATSDSTIDFHDDQFWEKVLGPKPLQRLQGKVQDGSITKASIEEIKEFLLELRELARAVVVQRQNGKIREDANDISSLLVELKVMGPKRRNLVNVRDIVSEWLDIMERPTRRRNAEAPLEVMYHPFLDGERRRSVEKQPEGRGGEQKQQEEEEEEESKKKKKMKMKMKETLVAKKERKSGNVVKRGRKGKVRYGERSDIVVKIVVQPRSGTMEVSDISSKKKKTEKRIGFRVHTKSLGRRVKQKTSKEAKKKAKVPMSEEEASESAEEDEDENEKEDEENDDLKEEEEEAEAEEEEEVILDNTIGGDEDLFCCVCYSDEGYEDDPIVQCDKCKIAVHKFCYGIKEIPEGDAPWYCSMCQNAVKQPQPCVMCPVIKSSAMKPMASNFSTSSTISSSSSSSLQWAHVICALWNPDASFQDSDFLEGINYVPPPTCTPVPTSTSTPTTTTPLLPFAPALSKEKAAVCELCQKDRGCIQCSTLRCKNTFHPVCAREGRKNQMFISDKGDMFSYCLKHSKK